ncbi:MAG: hypothetical protein CMJ47_14195 [Planctomyces sp.]|nr:hypothetical protein [Planctomyces sp.]
MGARHVGLRTVVVKIRRKIVEVLMNNPYEELEYLADFLPDEGESVIVSRRRGQLVCESYFEPMTSSSNTQSQQIDRELYGRLSTVESRLRLLWQTPAMVSVLSFYWVCVVLHRVFELGWSAWYLDLGLGMMILVGCYQYVQYQRRRYFLESVCPALQKWMVEHQLDKYTLIAWLTAHRNLSTLRDALTRWT